MEPTPKHETPVDRRGALGAIGVALAGCATAAHARRPGGGAEHDEAEVSPAEDLMQEHGVLQRVLLIYDEAARRIDAREALDPAVVTAAADVVHRFIEDYHERTEERVVFPRLEAARREVAVVATLRRQHVRGREVTAAIARLAGSAGGGGAELAAALRSFARMYRPHASREDTVVFPAFRELVGRSEYRELGERFEEEEHARFGEGGFERTVAELARLDAALGLDDLARFTP